MEEQRSLVRQWEGRVAETETMYRGKLATLENDHRAAIESMRKVTITSMSQSTEFGDVSPNNQINIII